MLSFKNISSKITFSATTISISINISDAKQSIKQLLRKIGIPETTIKRITKSDNQILINGKKASTRYWLKADDLLEIVLYDCDAEHKFVAIDKKIDIRYEDEQILIVYKPSGLLTTPLAKRTDSLVARVLNYYQINGLPNYKIHIVTRLDESTSGLVLIAKNGLVHNLLSEQKIIKKYHALVWGRVFPNQYIINTPIAKMENHTIKRTICISGKPAHTEIINSKYFEKQQQSLLDIQLHTGRTHQIRVHLASINAPIVYDNLYGYDNEVGEMALQCYYLELINPFTKIKIIINDDLIMV